MNPANPIVASAVQKAELIGGESWWDKNSGSLFIAVAAIVGASLAAYISIRNHKEQLAHDREIRDRDDIRNTIDRAVEAMSDFILRGVTFSGHIRTLEKTREMIGEVAPEDTEALSTRQKEVSRAEAAANKVIPPIYAAINNMHGGTILLAIRLGDDNPVTTTHAKTREALKQWIMALEKGKDQNRNAEELQAAAEGIKMVRNARSDFESACFTWMRGSA